MADLLGQAILSVLDRAGEGEEMQIDLGAALVLLAMLMAFDVAVALVAWRAAGRRGLSPRLAALCAILLGFLPPLNVAYLALISLLRPSPSTA